MELEKLIKTSIENKWKIMVDNDSVYAVTDIEEYDDLKTVDFDEFGENLIVQLLEYIGLEAERV
jgi:hypothetical protein